MAMAMAMKTAMAFRMRMRIPNRNRIRIPNRFDVRHAARMHTGTRTHRKGGPALVSATGGRNRDINIVTTNININTIINTNTNTNTNTTGAGMIRLQVRNLNLHEWSSMELLRENGIATPRGYLAKTPDEAEELFRKHFADDDDDSDNDNEGSGFGEAVLKAQVLSGSRYSGTFDNGFCGGVHVVSDPQTARTVADRMLGHKLITQQAPDGLFCRQVMVQEKLRLSRELYVSIWMDRSSQGPLLIGSPLGGSVGVSGSVSGSLSGSLSGSDSTSNSASTSTTRGSRGSRSLVEVARSHPHLVFVEEIDVQDGLEADRCERMAENLGLDPGTKSFDQAVDCMQKLYRVFVNCDCTQIEVNPLGEATMIGSSNNNDNNDNADNDNADTTRMVVVDAKVQFDDNAEFRQPDIFALRDYDQVDPREAEATKHGIDYIGLGNNNNGNNSNIGNSNDSNNNSNNNDNNIGNSNIGCMVNGAGLAMATMDLVVAHGGKPSNFLDVGGGATPEQVRIALGILEKDPSVRVVLVNIFGGLMRCDVIARGILELADEAGMSPKTPVVIRLQGTNYREAEAVLARSGLRHVYLEGDLDDAVRLAVKLAENTNAEAETEAEAETNAEANATSCSGGGDTTTQGDDKGDALEGADFVSKKRNNNNNNNDDNNDGNNDNNNNNNNDDDDDDLPKFEGFSI